MKKEKVQHGKMVLVGISTPTNNSNEMDLKISKIPALANEYWTNQVANNFKRRTVVDLFIGID